jgi:hypothetical protein
MEANVFVLPLALITQDDDNDDTDTNFGSDRDHFRARHNLILVHLRSLPVQTDASEDAVPGTINDSEWVEHLCLCHPPLSSPLAARTLTSTTRATMNRACVHISSQLYDRRGLLSSFRLIVFF